MRILSMILMLWLGSGVGLAAEDRGDMKTAAPAAGKQRPAPAPAEAGKSHAPDSLEAAYKREFAFLETQKRALTRQLATIEQRTKQQRRTLESKIGRLENQVLDLSLLAERLQEQISQAEARQEAARENEALLDMTFTQAKATLADYGFELPESWAGLPETEKLREIFVQADRALSSGSRLRRGQGKFFLPGGREVSGDLIFLGNIAAWGVSGEHAGMLIPAGEGRFKMLDRPRADVTAKALLQGRVPATLQAFIFESRDKAVEIRKEKTWMDTLNDGGGIAWLIAALGGVAAFLIGVRAWSLFRITGSGNGLVKRVTRVLREKGVEPALSLVDGTGGAYAAVLKASLRHLKEVEEEWEIAVSDALLQQSVRIDRFSGMILVIAAVSPLLGLLGTVTGMIATFDVITTFGTGDPKMLASGISVALVTTQVGLIVAIPALMLGNLLSGWAERIKSELELAAMEIREVWQGEAMDLPADGCLDISPQPVAVAEA